MISTFCRTQSFIVSLGWILGVLSPAIAQVATPTSIDQWRKDFESNDVEMRRAAAIATLRADRSTQKELLPTMIVRLREDSDGQVRLALFDTLREMGPDAETAADELVLAMQKNFGGRYNEELHQDYRAALALAAIGPAAVPKLRSLLDSDEKLNVRAEAVMALGRIGAAATPAVDQLIALLADEEPRLQTEARVALGRLSEPAMDELVGAVKHDNASIRAGVIDAIGHAEEVPLEAMEALIAATEDDHAQVRAAAIRAIRGKPITAARTHEVLVNRLSDPSRQVRLAVVNWVVNDIALLRSLREALASNLRSTDEGIAWHAAFLLQELGSEGAGILLQAAQETENHVDQIGRALGLVGPAINGELVDALSHSHPSVRQAAAHALGEIRPTDDKTVNALTSGLHDEFPAVQVACLVSLGRLRSVAPESLLVARRLLVHKSPEIRFAAVDALSRIAPRDDDLVEALITTVADDAPKVQQRSLEVLTSLGPLGQRALPAVTRQLQSKNDEVRQAALNMIGSLGSNSGESLPDLMKLLEDSDSSWRKSILKTIGKLGTAAQPAVNRLQDLQSDPSAEIREASLRTIGDLRLESDDLLPIVRRGLEDESTEVRSRAFRVARQLGDRSPLLLPVLIPMVSNDEEARSVERTLERMERYVVPKSVVPELAELTSHDSDRVRVLAIRFLGLAGPSAQTALPNLESLIQSEKESIRDEAVDAIEKIRG